jgi:hypothetical protein
MGSDRGSAEGNIVSRFLAQVWLASMALLIMVGNMYYTYGLWPRSWRSFFLFGGLTLVLIAIRIAIENEEKNG